MKEDKVDLSTIRCGISNIFLCGECEHLDPTEREQSKKKEPHFCNKYKVRVYHREYHPEIHKCSVCVNEMNIIKFSNINENNYGVCSSYFDGKCLEELNKYCDGCSLEYRKE